MSLFLKPPAQKKRQFKRKRLLDSVFKGEKPVKGPIELKHRRIFILPTRNGLNFIILLTVLLLVAFIYNNNLTYLLAFILIGVLMVTILLTFKSLAGLVISVGQNKPVFVGDNATVQLLIDNPDKHERFNLEFRIEQTVKTDIAAFSQHSVNLIATPQQRGWFQYGTIRVSSLFPLGLFRAWSPLRFDQPILIYPKPASTNLTFHEAASLNSTQGRAKTGGNDDFYGLHSYKAGDAIKQIHWKAFAKGQGLLTKQFSDDKANEIWLDYESTPGHNTEERLSQLCRWVMDAEANGLNYGFRLPGLTLAPTQGRSHYQQCLQALALF